MSAVEGISFNKGICADNADGVVRDKQKLQKACQSFEGLMLAQIWKSQLAVAKALGPNEREPFHQMQDLVVEMASDRISSLGGVGLWKFLYEEIERQSDSTRK